MQCAGPSLDDARYGKLALHAKRDSFVSVPFPSDG
jgi:hypothetical protein